MNAQFSGRVRTGGHNAALVGLTAYGKCFALQAWIMLLFYSAKEGIQIEM
jgi:hypothetical protein